MSSADIVVGEVIGTAILIPFGAGVVAAVVLNHSKAKDAGWVVIAPGWGFGVMAGAYTAAPLSGGARHWCVERPRRAEVPLAEGRRVDAGQGGVGPGPRVPQLAPGGGQEPRLGAGR